VAGIITYLSSHKFAERKGGESSKTTEKKCGPLPILYMSKLTLTTWQSQALYNTSPEFLAHYSRSKVGIFRQAVGGGGGKICKVKRNSAT
jgi:hypothetical protein